MCDGSEVPPGAARPALHVHAPVPEDVDERERSHPGEEVVMAMRQTAPEAAPRSSKATWGLVCGVIAAISAIPFVPGPYFEYLFGVAAIVLGALGSQEASHGLRGRGSRCRRSCSGPS